MPRLTVDNDGPIGPSEKDAVSGQKITDMSFLKPELAAN